MFLWIAATVCAFFVKGLCGFANTLVFTTILSFGNSNVNISPVELLLGYPSNLILAWKERKSIKWKVCVPLIALVIGGSIPGALFLKNMDASIIKIIFGAPIIMFVIFETIAITLWLTKDNLFYLFNFSYIGMSISLGLFLYIRKVKNARRIVQFLVGTYIRISLLIE